MQSVWIQEFVRESLGAVQDSYVGAKELQVEEVVLGGPTVHVQSGHVEE